MRASRRAHGARAALQRYWTGPDSAEMLRLRGGWTASARASRPLPHLARRPAAPRQPSSSVVPFLSGFLTRARLAPSPLEPGAAAR
jgi:hypothetical protein